MLTPPEYESTAGGRENIFSERELMFMFAICRSPGATERLLEAKPPQCVTQASPDSEACNKNLTDSVDVSCHI